MRLDIRYRTVFEYDEPVRESQNELRACPVSDDRQQLIAYRVTTSPSSRTLSYTDYWGTRVDHFGVREPHLRLEVLAEAAVETSPRPPISAMPTLDALDDPSFRDLHGEYLERSPHCDWAGGIVAEARRIVEINGPDLVRTVFAMHGLVGARLAYRPGSTDIGQPIEEIMAGGVGVCQDFAHLAVALCRSVGIPARYVSGYLFSRDDATGEIAGTGELVRVQTHAWFEAAVPGLGWLPLDPTNRLEVGYQHVKIGHGRDYDDVPPLRGSYSGHGTPKVDAGVEIRRMDPTRQPATLVQPSAPRSLEARMIQERQQQQQ
ncbi:MAG: transglutaminase domain-containing protein [Acidimicrobiales bacterium]